MATAHDAELILKLYELRTEAMMRESRAIVGALQFDTYADLQKLQAAAGTRENAAWRQVISYWEMAATLVLHGTLDAQLFLDTNGENFFHYVKLTPFFADYVKATGQPFMPRLTKLIEGYAAYQARYTMQLAKAEAQKKQAGG